MSEEELRQALTRLWDKMLEGLDQMEKIIDQAFPDPECWCGNDTCTGF